MSEKGLQDLADARFAKIFGQLQRQVGDAIAVFCAEVAPGRDVWLDDTRMLAILEVTQEDVRPSRMQEPATWWQHFKRDHFPAWLVRLFPVQRISRPCVHLPWDTWGAGCLAAYKVHVRQQLEKELMDA